MSDKTISYAKIFLVYIPQYLTLDTSILVLIVRFLKSLP